MLGGVAVIAGHGFPIWLGFVGGRRRHGQRIRHRPVPARSGAGRRHAGAVFAVTRRFLPTLVVAIVGTLAAAMLLGEGALTLGIVVTLFALTGVKRVLDDRACERSRRPPAGIAQPAAPREPNFLLGQVLTVLLLAQVWLVVWNVRVVRRPAARRWSAGAPLLSVLVPARNEEASIRACLEALLAQDYPNFEIIVLDDRSTDGTAATTLARRDPRVRLVRGAELPDGWTGKNWACTQLAREARGDVLCFVDADTNLQPETLSRASGELQERDLGLVSMLLRTDTGTVAEGVLMPMVNYAVLGLLPAALIERPGFPRVAVALGPFIMVTRTAYVAAGGHAAEPAHIVDDMRLARAVKASGHRVGLRNGTTLIRTRWYTGFHEIWNGFSNAYGGWTTAPASRSFALCIVAPALLFPFLRLGAALTTGGRCAAGRAGRAHPDDTRDRLTRRTRSDVVVPLHPVAVTVWAATLARSMSLARAADARSNGRAVRTRPVLRRSAPSRSEPVSMRGSSTRPPSGRENAARAPPPRRTVPGESSAIPQQAKRFIDAEAQEFPERGRTGAIR